MNLVSLRGRTFCEHSVLSPGVGSLKQRVVVVVVDVVVDLAVVVVVVGLVVTVVVVVVAVVVLIVVVDVVGVLFVVVKRGRYAVEFVVEGRTGQLIIPNKQPKVNKLVNMRIPMTTATSFVRYRHPKTQIHD